LRTPFSTRWFFWDGVPSSSTRNEPRENGTVPSSQMSTTSEQTFWPNWKARSEVFLRMPSPSSEWPKHSCTSTPPQPGAMITG
jgi:hypothetical protein